MPRVRAENLSVVTDEYPVYKMLGLSDHQRVNHKSGEYVRGEIYSNTAEGFLSLLKRGINGAFHHVSRGHLNRYCDEFAFRYENRNVSDGQRVTMIVAGTKASA